jgi:hypothetical protein
MASQIKVGDKTLNLRTNEGKPQWNVNEFMNVESRNAPALKGSDKLSNPCE